MPFIQGDKIAKTESRPGVRAKTLVGEATGSVALTMTDARLDPGSKSPVHIHPNEEEAVLVLEGSLEVALGEEVRTLRAGDVLLAPPGMKHGLSNSSGQMARVITTFPSNAPKTTYL